MGWQKESWRTLKRDTSDNVFFSVRGSTFSSEQEGKGRNRKKKRTQPEKWTVRAIHPREKAENERRRGGKGERGPHKYSRVDGRRQGGERWTAEEKGDRTRAEAGIANERTKEGGKELCDDGAHSGRFYSREALVAAGRFRTINSVLWSAKSYDGNRVNHTGTRSRVRRPRVSVWDARGHIPAPHAYTLHVSGRA